MDDRIAKLKFPGNSEAAYLWIIKLHPHDFGYMNSTQHIKDMYPAYLKEYLSMLLKKLNEARIKKELAALAAKDSESDKKLVTKLSKGDTKLLQKYNATVKLLRNLENIRKLWYGYKAGIKIDGHLGSATYAAIKDAKQRGYNVNVETGEVTKIKGWTSLTQDEQKYIAKNGTNSDAAKQRLALAEQEEAEWDRYIKDEAAGKHRRSKLIDPSFASLKNFNPLAMVTNATMNTIGETFDTTLGNVGRAIGNGWNSLTGNKDRHKYHSFSVKNIALNTNDDMELGKGMDPFTLARNASEGNYAQMAENGLDIATLFVGGGASKALTSGTTKLLTKSGTARALINQYGKAGAKSFTKKAIAGAGITGTAATMAPLMWAYGTLDSKAKEKSPYYELVMAPRELFDNIKYTLVGTDNEDDYQDVLKQNNMSEDDLLDQFNLMNLNDYYQGNNQQ